MHRLAAQRLDGMPDCALMAAQRLDGTPDCALTALLYNMHQLAAQRLDGSPDCALMALQQQMHQLASETRRWRARLRFDGTLFFNKH